MPAGDVDVDTGALVGIQSWVASRAAKGILPIGRFKQSVALGVGFMDVDGDKNTARGIGDGDSGVIGCFCGGFDILRSDHVVASVAIDYVIPNSSIGDFDYISFGVGVQYRF